MTTSFVPSVKTLVPEGVTTAQLVRTAVSVMIVLHLAFRAWAVLPAWFYSDDLRFIEDARASALSPHFLLTPHDSQLMPVGVLISWVVAHAGTYVWVTAAALTLVLQAAAAVSCYVMLRTAFGERWGILAPLAVFLFSPMGIEGTMWWSASLNALPMQTGFMLMVACVLQWSLHHRPIWAGGAAAAFALTVASGPRGVVTVVPVGLLIMLFLTHGPWWRRPVDVVRQHALLLVPLVVVGAGYLALYATTTTSPVAADGGAPLSSLAGNLVGRAWLPSIVGGPWHWDVFADPVGVPAAPRALLVAAVVVVVLGAAVLVRRNPGPTCRALAIMAGQLVVTYLALVFGRALQLGALAGLNMRYLADALSVTVLVIGLATMPLLVRGAPSFRRPLPSPHDLSRMARAGLSLGAVLFLVGSVISTVTYVQPWHRTFPAREWVTNAVNSLRADPSPVADLEVPELVQLGIHYPSNLPSHILAPYGDLVQIGDAGNDLRVFNARGIARQAVVEGEAETRPDGDEGCGARVDDQPTVVTLDREKMSIAPWTAISYAGSAPGRVSVRADERQLPDLEIAPGPHTYILRTDGAYSQLTLQSRTSDAQMCIDTVRAGQIKALP